MAGYSGGGGGGGAATSVTLGSGGLSLNTAQTPDTLYLATDTAGNSLVLADSGDTGFDFAHAQKANPTIFIHSEAQSTTQWLGLEFNNTVSTFFPGARYTRGSGTHLFDNSVNVDATFSFGAISASTNGARFIPINTAQTPDSSFLAPGSTSNHIIVAEFDDVGFDFAHAQQTNPTLFIHSAAQSTTGWISFAHNNTDGVIDVGAGGLDLSGITGTYKYDRTITAGGTTGAQTINKTSGTVNFATGATTLVVTNSLVDTSSIVYAVVRTNDTTATIKNVVPAAGSFTITLGAMATAETSVGFFVTN